MYAIVKTGGKQYRVEAGDVINVERLSVPEGAAVRLEDVLLVADPDGGVRVGAPKVEGSAVVGTVVEQGRDKKIRVFKYKKRKHYRRLKGHRQSFTAVRVDKIET